MSAEVGGSNEPEVMDEQVYEIGSQQRKASDFVTQSTLKKELKLSDQWFARLGEPDKTAVNPHYCCAAPMKLYGVERVMSFLEAHAVAYREHLQRHARRSAISRELMERRLAPVREQRAQERAEAEEWAYGAKIVLKPFPEDLYAAAQEHYDRRDDYDRPLRPRAVLAMLRHEYTNYEALLRESEKLGDPLRAYDIIKARVMAAVCERSGIWDPFGRVSSSQLFPDRQVPLPFRNQGRGLATGE